MRSTPRLLRSKRLSLPLLERGRRLGIDVGSVRVGVAICDPDGLIATPLITLPANSALASIVDLIAEYEIKEVVIGLPKHLKGSEGASAVTARDFGEQLRGSVEIPIAFVDERLTSKSAAFGLSATGVKTKDQRGLVDQIAAATILQLYLDGKRA